MGEYGISVVSELDNSEVNKISSSIRELPGYV